MLMDYRSYYPDVNYAFYFCASEKLCNDRHDFVKVKVHAGGADTRKQ
jgi:hypothetical protein